MDEAKHVNIVLDSTRSHSVQKSIVRNMPALTYVVVHVLARSYNIYVLLEIYCDSIGEHASTYLLLIVSYDTSISEVVYIPRRNIPPH